jgi:SAM-dependent methyltransferase
LLPNSRFVGIDISPKQIEQGQQLLASAGLQNVELQCRNILDFSDPQPFDYIIAHGFYSWVPPEVRDKALQICQQSLAPTGLAYFSFNTLPGWHIKRISRDMMLFHSRNAPNSAQRVALAREMLAMARANPPPQKTPYSMVVERLAEGIGSYPDWYLEHDELELSNEPVYFEEFIRHARSLQLRYVGGAQPQMNVFLQLPAKLRKELLSFANDPIQLEQYADFFWGTQYRDTVLCRSDAAVGQKQGAAALSNMCVAAWLVEQPFLPGKQRSNDVRFLLPRQKRELMVSDAGLTSVLRQLAQAWPHSVALGDLHSAFAKDDRRGGSAAAQTAFLSNQIISWYLANIIELWTRPSNFIAKAPSHPKMTPLVRVQAESGLPLINLRHEECRFEDAKLMDLFVAMDGTRDHATLFRIFADITNKGATVSNPKSREFFDHVLATLSNQSLFVESI